MSTLRNNQNTNRLNFNVIVDCYEYSKVPVKPYDCNMDKYGEAYKKGEFMKKKVLRDSDIPAPRGGNHLRCSGAEEGILSIPKNIRWAIEEDFIDGAQLLADHFNKVVVVEIKETEHNKLPKNAVDNCNVRGPGGAFESNNYVKPGKNYVVTPSAAAAQEEDGRKIRLIVSPAKDHYYNRCEYRKTTSHNYCLPCMLYSTSTAATIGSGYKSAQKTKGRMRREKVSLFVAGMD